ncbi:MAG: septum formation protein Maf [Candidatus Levybacteria bacterium RIFCSPHIGHO2_02_FULL_37_10]|nr:MAG: septum formation protein Maf [Candidatus Levybacteria bacterium RIFCSPHIGHO2_02_FULL_37_10]OGH42248.1 MAG: septum formation protein Maf [Candidatus Levybacteria bacterium RIFCSPLOWO2_02_FULL_36_8b]
MKNIILASKSPRRKELLGKIGLKFKVIESEYREIIDSRLNPHELVEKLSLEKAKIVHKNHKNSIIIAADTIVVCDGRVLGKPKDKKDAKQMLGFLSGKVHLIITGLTIIDGELNKIITRSEETKVYMRKISPKEIDSYLKTKEPYDKAGAYAIQEIGSIFIEKIEGDYLNAVGLPIYSLVKELKNLGVEVL